MKAKELRRKTDKELANLILKSREKLRQLRFKVSTKEIKNVRAIPVIKKDIARILTILNERKRQK